MKIFAFKGSKTHLIKIQRKTLKIAPFLKKETLWPKNNIYTILKIQVSRILSSDILQDCYLWFFTFILQVFHPFFQRFLPFLTTRFIFSKYGYFGYKSCGFVCTK